MTDDLAAFTAFLEARLDEAEARAQDPHWADARGECYECGTSAPRMLREVAAKRAILGQQTSDHAPVETQYGLCCRTCVDWQDVPVAEGGETEFGIAIPQQWPCRVARAAAAAWSDHEDYRAEWKP